MADAEACAPVALFVYNRPQHTRRTVEALRANRLAADTDLIVFSDGARGSVDEAAVQEVRAFVRDIEGFRSTTLVEQPRNRGLASSIIEGVGTVLRQYGRVIVLEDDLQTAPDFLAFMNDALRRYAGEERVMHISGYSYPMPLKGLPETFFLRPTTCWGWATWARAWSHFEKDTARLLREMGDAEIKDFNLGGAYDYFGQIVLNQRGLIDTWAVYWYASVYRARGLSLHPRTSFVRNIGHDGSGVHRDVSEAYEVELESSVYPLAFESRIELSSVATAALARYFRSLRTPLWRRVLRKLIKIVRGGG